MDSVSFKYKLSAENVLECFKFIGKENKKSLKYAIYAGIFIALCIVWIISYVQNPSSNFSIFLAVVCFGFSLVSVWMPSKMRKDIAIATEEADREFYMEFSEGKIFFSEEKNDFIEISGDYKFYETDNIFIIDCGNEKVFCAPKNYIEENKVSLVRAYLSSAGEKFADKRRKLEEKVNG